MDITCVNYGTTAGRGLRAKIIRGQNGPATLKRSRGDAVRIRRGSIMRFSRAREPVRISVSGAIKPESVHLLTEYVLNMSMSAREDNDITPLYETYLRDVRLTEFEKEELMWVYMSLQLQSSPPAEEH